MSKLKNKAVCAVLCHISAFCVSCDFANLNPIEFSMNPAEQNLTLLTRDTPVSVTFDSEMNRKECESLLGVTSSFGYAEGDMVWNGNTLEFYPVGGWKPGVRYTFKMSGILSAKDGRQDSVHRAVGFYAETAAQAPYLVRVTPENGASVGTSAAEGAVLHLVFSQEMDRMAVEDALVFEGVSDRKFDWLNDLEVEVYGEKQLSPWTSYRWSLSKDARDLAGIPLAAKYGGTFITDADRALPRVLKAMPLLRSFVSDGSYSWRDTGLTLNDGLGFEHGIGVDFSKEMDAGSMLRAVQIEPSLSGRTEKVSARRLVFIPERAPETGKTYRLTIRADTKDSGGLSLNEDYTEEFEIDIPYLRIESVQISSADVTDLSAEEFVNGASCAVKTRRGEGSLALRITFSDFIYGEERSNVPLNITLSPHYPPSLSRPGLRRARWVPFSPTLEFDFEGVDPGNDDEPHHYKLTLPGGAQGTSNGRGSYLRENITFYIGAEE